MKYYISVIVPHINELDRYMLLEKLEEYEYLGAEESDEGMILYFEEQKFNDQVQSIIQDTCQNISIEKVEEQNWNAAWESNFDPVMVDDFCYVKAFFHPENDHFQHVIHITPKMSFGTGHHATTFQVLQRMRHLNWEDKDVLDFGTGTGILAILSEKLGAKNILAIDNDPWSVENAIENVNMNDCKNINVENGSIQDYKNSKFHIIIANINRNILMEYMKDMTHCIHHDGHIIMSGILVEDYNIIIDEAKIHGLSLQDETSKNNWLCLTFQKHTM